jgi:hypothetical protein
MKADSGPGGESIAATWARFKVERGRELDAWLRAERTLAAARVRGLDDLIAGERLLAAEASLQTAIVDFAASQTDVVNPSPLALQILRMAEATLDSARSRRVSRARTLREAGNPPAPVPAIPAPRKPARGR